MDSPVSPRSLHGWKFTLVAGLSLLTTDALFAQSAGQSDVDALKAQMNQMQRQYEQRIEAMEGKMKALESNANSGSILNTRVLTDADGKEMPGKAAPMLDESFLKSLTRNFTFNVYMRAGVAFNGSGGAQGKTSFIMPDNYVGGGRSTSRLGNEDDFYTELAWSQAHLLGDSPDLADASFTAQIQAFSSPVKSNAINTNTKGFGIGMNQGYAEIKNVIKSAPEITFWGGDRFYDRWNIDSEDYFWLNTSGFGVGVYNIPVGPGTLWLAWLGNNNDNLNENGGTSLFNTLNDHVGNLYKQTFDIRYKDVDIGFGKLTFVLIGNYVKGDTFEESGSTSGLTTFVRDPITGTVTTTKNVTGVVKTQDMYGLGGGVIWEYDFGNKSMFRLSGLYGYGATDFQGDITNQINSVNSAWDTQVNRALNGRSSSATVLSNGDTFVAVNPINRNTEALATAYFVWNPSPVFSLGVWANWEYNDNGTQALGIDNNGNLKVAGGSRNIVSGGVRPVFWVAPNIAIQGVAAASYIDNVRSQTGAAFGRSGEEAIFTIAPTIKPSGGFFTRPEIRVFATFAAWSNSLKGTSASGGQVPYSNGNASYGWLFGSQMEIWF